AALDVALAVAERRDVARRVTLRRLDEDDLGADLGEDAAAQLRIRPGEVEDPDARQEGTLTHPRPPLPTRVRSHTLLYDLGHLVNTSALVITNAKVRTLVDERVAEMVAIDRGRIAHVGSSSDARSYPQAEVLD